MNNKAKKIWLFILGNIGVWGIAIIVIFGVLFITLLGNNKENNDSTVYDGNAPVSGQALVNAMAIVTQLKAEEANTKGIAGSLANAQRESEFDEKAINTGGGVAGVFQWSGFGNSINGNRITSEGSIKAGNVSTLTIANQMKLLHHELNGGYKDVKEYLKTASSATDASDYWSVHFEGLAISDGQSAVSKTHGFAEAWYAYLNGGGSTGGGAGGIKALDKILGQALDIDGAFGAQCYDLTAYYVETISHFRPLAPLGGASGWFAESPTQWTSHGWTITKKPSYSQLKAGDVINFQPGGEVDGWNVDSTYGHTGVVGKVLGNNQYVLYEQGGGASAHTSTYHFNASGVASIIRPPK